MLHICAFFLSGYQFILFTSHSQKSSESRIEVFTSNIFVTSNSYSSVVSSGYLGGPQFLYHTHSKKVNPCTNQLNPGVGTSPIEVHKDADACSPLNLWCSWDHLLNNLKVTLVVLDTSDCA